MKPRTMTVTITIDDSAVQAAIARALAQLAVVAPDQHALDAHPDRCWRCDAKPSSCDLGLCEPCREVLT